ncbi:MAG TPA: response regulator [Ktedonobacterales bacterium]|nr:response regulator [Ktedonobacterales bacterium]
MAERYRILIVDDNHDLLALITESLALLGDYEVETVDNGAEGLKRAVELRPDCVIIDIRMPGLDGYQLVRALRGDAQTASLPLVILTALTQEYQRFAGLLAGADHYLTKPIKPSDLVAAIEETIRLSQEERKQRLQALLDTPDGEPDGAL